MPMEGWLKCLSPQNSCGEWWVDNEWILNVQWTIPLRIRRVLSQRESPPEGWREEESKMPDKGRREAQTTSFTKQLYFRAYCWVIPGNMLLHTKCHEKRCKTSTLRTAFWMGGGADLIPFMYNRFPVILNMLLLQEVDHNNNTNWK